MYAVIPAIVNKSQRLKDKETTSQYASTLSCSPARSPGQLV